MSDETITQAERERMRECADGVARYHTERARYGGASREFHILAEPLLKVSMLRLLAALTAAEKRAEEAERALMIERDGAGERIHDLAADLARLRSLVDAARAYATTVGNRKARSDLLNAAFDLFAEEVLRG